MKPKKTLKKTRAKKARSKHLLTTNTSVVIESDFAPVIMEHGTPSRMHSGYSDTLTWGEFVEANSDLPELEDVAEDLRQHGRATIGGGASPLTVVRLA